MTLCHPKTSHDLLENELYELRVTPGQCGEDPLGERETVSELNGNDVGCPGLLVDQGQLAEELPLRHRSQHSAAFSDLNLTIQNKVELVARRPFLHYSIP